MDCLYARFILYHLRLRSVNRPCPLPVHYGVMKFKFEVDGFIDGKEIVIADGGRVLKYQ